MKQIKLFFEKHGIVAGLILIFTLLGFIYKAYTFFDNNIKLKIEATQNEYVLDPNTSEYINSLKSIIIKETKDSRKYSSKLYYNNLEKYNNFISLKVSNKGNKKIENIEIHLQNSGIATIIYPNKKTLTQNFDNIIELDDLKGLLQVLCKL